MTKLYISNEFCTAAQIEKLGKIMPNLMELQVGFGNHGFEVVCKIWGKMKILLIQPCQVDEDGLLGMKAGEKYQRPNVTNLQGEF